MKKISLIAIIFALCMLVIAYQSNKKVVYVYDNENDLTSAQIKKFDSLFRSHEKKTSNEIVLVTTPGFGADSNIIRFAQNIGDYHAIGKKGKHNGIVIVFSATKREVRIGTGKGIEKVLLNNIAKQFIDSLMTPRFRQAEYFEGLWEGSKAVVYFLEKPENKIK